MKTYIIREDLAQAVIGYLATRPYQEVAPLIAAMQQMPENNTAKVAIEAESKDDHPG